MTENSFKILDVPENATSTEIKTRYRQLVRFFHPDNFETNSDRSFAENKLKEINAAYNSLVRAKAATFPMSRPELLPEPVIFPTALDFGPLPRNAALQEMVYILNVGEQVEQFDIVYNSANPWLKISQSRQLEAKKQFPMALTVSVDTSTLKRGKKYQEWISIVMDSVVTKVPVSVHVPWVKFLAGLSIRLLSFLVLVGFLFGTASSLGILYALSGFSSGEAATSGATFVADIAPGTLQDPLPNTAQDTASDGSNRAIQEANTDTGTHIRANASTNTDINGNGLAVLSVADVDSSAVAPNALVSQTVAATATTQTSVSAVSNAIASTLAVPTVVPPVVPTVAPTVEATVLPTIAPISTATPLPQPTETALPPTATSVPPTAVPNTPIPPPTEPAPASQPVAALMVVPDTYSVNARAGTSTEFAILQELPAGTILPAIGRNSDSTWLYIRLSDGRQAWAFIDVIVINQDLLAQLPIVQ